MQVFVADGVGAGLAHVELAGDPRLRLVVSPRHATVLLAVGEFPGHLGDALVRVHDQLVHPRAVAWWGTGGAGGIPAVLPGAVEVAGDMPSALVQLQRGLLTGEVATSADLLPDKPPNAFQGKGDHGQGGEGMMGGVPWGRPMAMTADDRDGLSLDGSSARLGPFLLGLPPATAADVVLQGGVVQNLALVAAPASSQPPVDSLLQLWATDREGAPGGAELHRGRARHLLRWTAEACRLGGLDALAARASAVAAGLGAGVTGPANVDHLIRRVSRSGLPRTWRGVGIDVIGDGRDSADRLRGRLDDLRIATELTFNGLEAGDRSRKFGAPWMTVDRDDLNGIANALIGLDWSDTLITLCSLNLMVNHIDERTLAAS